MDLKETFQTDLQTLRGAVDTEALTVTEVKVAPRKSDLEIESLLLVWRPWRVSTDGTTRPATGRRLGLSRRSGVPRTLGWVDTRRG